MISNELRYESKDIADFCLGNVTREICRNHCERSWTTKFTAEASNETVVETEVTDGEYHFPVHRLTDLLYGGTHIHSDVILTATQCTPYVCW